MDATKYHGNLGTSRIELQGARRSRRAEGWDEFSGTFLVPSGSPFEIGDVVPGTSAMMVASTDTRNDDSTWEEQEVQARGFYSGTARYRWESVESTSYDGTSVYRVISPAVRGWEVLGEDPALTTGAVMVPPTGAIEPGDQPEHVASFAWFWAVTLVESVPVGTAWLSERLWTRTTAYSVVQTEE
jgi:hypothetical protein